MARRAWVIVLVLVGCGARSGLDVSGDASTPPFDAGFDTFPCRWMFGEPTTVLTDVLGGRVQGGVHGSVDEAVGLAQTRTGMAGAVVSLAYPPPIVEVARRVDLLDGVFSAPDGYAGFLCDVKLYDRHFEATRELRIRDATICSAGQQTPSTLTALLGGELESRISEVDLATLTRTEVGFPLGRPVRPVRTASGGWLMLYYGPDVGGAGLAFVSAGGDVTRRDDAFPTGAVFLLPDRIRGAAVALWQDDSGWNIDRVAEDLTRLTLFRLGDVEINGEPVTNETELMVMLGDGSLTAAPLSGSALRPLEAPDEGIRGAQIALRPGTSAGGVFYHLGDELIFRPLVCNR